MKNSGRSLFSEQVIFCAQMVIPPVHLGSVAPIVMLVPYTVTTSLTSFTRTRTFPGHFWEYCRCSYHCLAVVCLLQCWGQPPPIDAQAACLHQQVHWRDGHGICWLFLTMETTSKVWALPQTHTLSLCLCPPLSLSLSLCLIYIIMIIRTCNNYVNFHYFPCSQEAQKIFAAKNSMEKEFASKVKGTVSAYLADKNRNRDV